MLFFKPKTRADYYRSARKKFLDIPAQFRLMFIKMCLSYLNTSELKNLQTFINNILWEKE
jgi:hypothetical protein